MSPAIFLLLAAAAAQGDTGSFVINNFRFASGEMLLQLRLHYRTLGRPRRDAAGVARNAVLILHGTGGSGGQFLSPLFAAELYGAGQSLDTATHYLILPDNIGHGRSSKPSDGLRARFPRYAYEDMVTAQYRLVTEGLHLTHLLLVVARRWAACTAGFGRSGIRTSWTGWSPSPAFRRRSRGATGCGAG